MHRLYDEIPPVLVVGVAYGHERAALQGEIRNRDFTPTANPAWEDMGRQMNPAWEPALPEGRRMGRAPEFLRFLVDEARPYVEARFETSPGRSVVFGSSMGGLFAAWSMLAEPGSFDHVIAVSPALWWDDGEVLKLEERLAADGGDPFGARDEPVKALLAAGSLEEPEHIPFVAQYRLISNARTLAERLEGRGYPSLDVGVQVIDGETHTSVPTAGLTRGLRRFFRPGPPAGAG
jgi:predicted alpha/beta superfamily hydrolase